MKVTNLMDFGGERQKVGVGYKFEEYDDGDVTIQPGDIGVFSDPDAGNHASGCELISQSITVGVIKGVYAVDYSYDEGYSVELDMEGVGRIEVDESYVGIIGENYEKACSPIGMGATRHNASRLIDSDEYDRYYTERWHMGEDDVPDGLWNAYADSSRSGPGCPYCRRDKGQDGMERDGE